MLPVSSSKKSSSHLVAKKLPKIATIKELFKPDLTTEARKKQGKTTPQKETQFKDSQNNGKENQKDPRNDQNTQKKNDSKPEENLEKSYTVQEEQTPAVFIDYKSHPKFNEELQNFENTLQEREVIQNFQTYNVSYDLASFIECYIGHCLTGSNGIKPDPAIIEDLFDSFEMIDGFSSASGILETLKLDKLKPPVMKFAINNAIENLSRLKYLMKGDLRALFVELICMLLNTSTSDKNFIQTTAQELSFGIISDIISNSCQMIVKFDADQSLVKVS